MSKSGTLSLESPGTSDTFVHRHHLEWIRNHRADGWDVFRHGAIRKQRRSLVYGEVVAGTPDEAQDTQMNTWDSNLSDGWTVHGSTCKICHQR